MMSLAWTLAFAAAAGSGHTAPADLAVPHAEGPSIDQPARIEPIGGYTLAILWSPEHCAHVVPGAESLQCGPAASNDFLLHGLWPDGQGKSWPQWCATAAILSPQIIAAYFPATPSAQLLQHEWAKHGTCIADMTPKRYFGRSNRLFRAIRYPDMVGLARAPLTAGAFTQAFAAANPDLHSETLTLNLDRNGWLREVWLCLDTKLKPKACATPLPASRPIRIRIRTPD